MDQRSKPPADTAGLSSGLWCRISRRYRNNRLAGYFGRFILVAILALGRYVTTVQAEQPLVTVATQHLSLEFALRAAHTALEFCRTRGFQVAVTVVDRSGHPQVVLRDTLARDLALPISRKKAYTAVSFGRQTSRLEDSAVGKALRREPTLLFAGGGVPIRAPGTIIAGIGVSGANTAQMDEQCALQGVRVVSRELDMLE